MATLYIKKFVCDLTGNELEEKDVHTIRLSVNGNRYIFDTNAAGVAAFQRDIAKYIQREDTSRDVEGDNRRSAADAKARRDHNRRVRAWAAENGHELNPRGVIPKTVLAAYADANG